MPLHDREGDTLSKRLERGPLPLDEALAIAMQIGDALDRAHQSRIVHRDLRPATVLLTPTGVKLLEATAAPATLQYTSPEQIERKDADHRSDIWALGCLLYEMITGKPAFQGSTEPSVIAAVLAREPEAIGNPALFPPRLAHVVKVALAKDPDRRWQSARDVVRHLEWIAGAPEIVNTVVDARRRRRRMALVAGAVALTALASIGATVAYMRRTAPKPSVLRLDIATLPTSDPMSMALSPDGRHLAYVATSNTVAKLWIRSLDQAAAKEIDGTTGASYPFWSPNGRSIGFFAGGKLLRIDLASGASTVLADAPSGRGGTWSTDDVIVFAPRTNAPLLRVDAAGGQPTSATQLRERQTNHRWPQFLPDGRRFLFSVAVNGEDINGLYVGSLDEPIITRVLPSATAALFAAPDSVLYVAQGTLVARHFDPETATVSGDPIVIAEDVGYDTALFRSAFTVSDNGVLAHRPVGPPRRQLTWFDRAGREVGTVGAVDESALTTPELAPDDRQVAVQRNVGGNSDIWFIDVDRGVASRVTSSGQNETAPIWSPDGQRVLYRAVSPRGGSQIFERPVDGPTHKVVFASPDQYTPLDWSRDGRFILLASSTPKSSGDLWVVANDGKWQPEGFLRTTFDEASAQFAPDGRWVAYESNETGRYQTYVRRFPATDSKWQISSDGGFQPRWSRDGKELFYVAPDNHLVAVTVAETATGVTFGAPRPLFRIQAATGTNVVSTGGFQRAQYAVGRDGRFLVNRSVDDATPPVTVVLNWTATLGQ